MKLERDNILFCKSGIYILIDINKMNGIAGLDNIISINAFGRRINPNIGCYTWGEFNAFNYRYCQIILNKWAILACPVYQSIINQINPCVTNFVWKNISSFLINR